MTYPEPSNSFNVMCKDQSRQLLEVEGSSIIPITERTIKTVGTGKDFETFHEAMRWAERCRTVGFGSITLSLDDGIHTPSSHDDHDDWEWSYYLFQHLYIEIQSASGNKANCKIALPPGDDGDTWPSFIVFYAGCTVIFKQVTIEPGAAGYPYPEHVTAIYSWGNTDITITSSDILGCYECFKLTQGAVGRINSFNSLGSSELITADGGTSVFAFMGAEIMLYQQTNPLTLDSAANGTGVHVSENSKVTVVAGSVTFGAGLTTDVNIPQNEIQYDSSVFCNRASALSFKA